MAPMTAAFRSLPWAAAPFLAAALTAAETSTLPKDSPFAPPAAVATAAAANEAYEFAGVSVIGPKTIVNIYEKAAKKGRWIAVGETSDGIAVARYDGAREEVVIRAGGSEKTLPLRKATQRTAAASLPPSPAAFTVAAAPAAPAAVPASGAAAIAEGVPAPLPPQSPPPAPGTVAHQEQEARMLVSDLLEIGIAQRKAYEEAQKRAAEQAAQAAGPTVAQPAPPAPPPSGG